jgi:[ribosomal protein S18]-alanine N-acetyltransferase
MMRGSDMTGQTDAFNPAHVSMLWARPEHAADIAALHATMFPAAWDQAAITGLLDHPGSVALVACLANPLRLGGFALAQVAADEAEILTIGVTPAWRRHGIGVRLIAGLERASRNAGAKRLFLEVAEANAAALQLYKATGFTEVGRRKGYYVTPGGTQDAIQLRKDL